MVNWVSSTVSPFSIVLIFFAGLQLFSFISLNAQGQLLNYTALGCCSLLLHSFPSCCVASLTTMTLPWQRSLVTATRELPLELAVLFLMIPAFLSSLPSVPEKAELCLWLSEQWTEAPFCLLKSVFTCKVSLVKKTPWKDFGWQHSLWLQKRIQQPLRVYFQFQINNKKKKIYAGTNLYSKGNVFHVGKERFLSRAGY